MSSSHSLLFTTSGAAPTPTVPLGPVTYDFQNYGPLTTTFTPAASCTESPDLTLGGFLNIFPDGPLVSRCTSDFADAPVTSCVPGDVEKAAYIKDNIGIPEVLIRHIPYHSPANICPLAWTTAGVAYKDARGSLTASGNAFNPTDTLTITPLSDPTANVIANNLKPLQTAIACCPSGYEANHEGGCWSVASDASAWTASTACAFADNRNEGIVYGEDVTFTYNGRVLTGALYNTGTAELSVTATTTFSVYPTSTPSETSGNVIYGDINVHQYVDQLFLINGGAEESSAPGNGTASSSAPVKPSQSSVGEPSAAARGAVSAGVATLLAVWGVAGLLGAGAFVL